MKYDIIALERALNEMRKELGDSVVATGIWRRQTEEVLAAINHQPVAATMFNALTDNIAAALNNSKFPKLHRYYFIDLEDDHLVLIIRHDTDVLQGTLLQASHCKLGMLLSVTIPKLIQQVADARLA